MLDATLELASQIRTDVSGFGGLLTASETTLQAALDRIDDYALDKTGDTMSGNLAMGTHDISGVGTLTAATLTDGTASLSSGALSGVTTLSMGSTLTLSGLTASRLLATNASKQVVSSDLASWITGTANRLSVTDDTDGTVTLSLPDSVSGLTSVSATTLTDGTASLTGGSITGLTNVNSVTATELSQLETIGATTISAAQWGYLGALDQSLTQASSPTFVGATLSGLTASRLVGTSAGSVLQSEDLASWVTGTANRLTVTDDTDGTITLTLPDSVSGLTSISASTITDGTWSTTAGVFNSLNVSTGTNADNFMTLRSGATGDYRNYFTWLDYDENEQWKVGRNASNHFVMFDVDATVHRLVHTAGAATHICSGDTNAVIINSYSTDPAGTGGLQVWSGTASPTIWYDLNGTDLVVHAGGIQCRDTGLWFGTTAVNGSDYQVALNRWATLWGSGGSESYINHNVYYNSGWKYREASVAATKINFANGFSIDVAGSGTKDGAVTFTHPLAITSAGVVTIGSTDSITMAESGTIGLAAEYFRFVHGTTQITSSSDVVMANATRTYYEASGSTKGTESIYSGADGYLDYNAATAHRFNTGNVGIGEAAPDALLHMKASGAACALKMERSSTTLAGTYAKIDAHNSADTAMAGIWFYANNDANPSTGGEIAFLTTPTAGAETEAMRINSSGNVGIGTTDPDAIFYSAQTAKALDIASATGAEIVLDHTDGGTTSHIGAITFARANEDVAVINANHDGATDAAYIAFHTQPTGGALTERMRITSAGNVGIGVTPSYPLHVKTATAGAQIIFELSADDDGGVMRVAKDSSDDASLSLFNGSGTTITFFSADTAVPSYHKNDMVIGDAKRTYYEASGTTAGTESIYSPSDGNLSVLAGTSITLDAPTVTVSDGALYVGADDSVRGSLYLYGSSGDTAGRMILYTGDNHDASIEYYLLYGNEDDFVIAANNSARLTYKGGEDYWAFASDVCIGGTELTNGTDLQLLGDGTLTMKEGTAPTADADHAKLWSQNDNALYFQDGAGTTKTVQTGLPTNYIGGLILSPDTDTDHDVNITAGTARDATDTVDMVLASEITKQIDAGWAVGDDAGGLDADAVAASTLYAVWLIKRSDTGVVDALFSTSFSAPTMPADYDYKRLIGAVKTDGDANIIKFEHSDTYFEYVGDALTAPPSDIYDVTITDNTWETGTLSSVPPGCVANIYAELSNPTSASKSDGILYIRPADAAANGIVWVRGELDANFDCIGARGTIKVDASSQINYAASEDGGAATVSVMTHGFWMTTRREP